MWVLFFFFSCGSDPCLKEIYMWLQVFLGISVMCIWNYLYSRTFCFYIFAFFIGSQFRHSPHSLLKVMAIFHQRRNFYKGKKQCFLFPLSKLSRINNSSEVVSCCSNLIPSYRRYTVSWFPGDAVDQRKLLRGHSDPGLNLDLWVEFVVHPLYPGDAEVQRKPFSDHCDPGLNLHRTPSVGWVCRSLTLPWELLPSSSNQKPVFGLIWCYLI